MHCGLFFRLLGPDRKETDRPFFSWELSKIHKNGKALAADDASDSVRLATVLFSSVMSFKLILVNRKVTLFHHFLNRW